MVSLSTPIWQANFQGGNRPEWRKAPLGAFQWYLDVGIVYVYVNHLESKSKFLALISDLPLLDLALVHSQARQPALQGSAPTQHDNFCMQEGEAFDGNEQSRKHEAVFFECTSDLNLVLAAGSTFQHVNYECTFGGLAMIAPYYFNQFRLYSYTASLFVLLLDLTIAALLDL